ncbi:MAG: cobyrinate a,c-diamide synthase [Bacillota bacterium]
MKGRILVGGTGSGSGKTTVTIALLGALKKRGIKLSAFKCGCDYIDPMFHREVLGVESGNIDSFFYTPEICREIFAESARDFSVIEGVMGFFDGGAGSTENVSKILDCGVILVVNGRGAVQSILATIHGFLTWKENNISGVILNNTSENVFLQISADIEKMGVRALGYLPRLPQDLILESRHLGLVTASEIAGLSEKIDKLSDIAEKTFDIDGILEMGFEAEEIIPNGLKISKKESVKIAVSRDEAFCFCYRENIAVLEKMGAEICYFSPLSDEKLPDCDGLYIVGGYPELYLDRLEKNAKLRFDIKNKIENKLPTIAECGGFMYLSKKIDRCEMCGVLDGECEKKSSLVRFGYVDMKSENGGAVLFENGFKGHEFHYYDSTANGGDLVCTKQNGTTWTAGFLTESLYAGFPHLAFLSSLESVENFYDKCLKYKKSTK